jgi:2-amino-4-hydroxy-6-hydroxymethyldihydropteridine diphosphokinase
MTKEIYLSLGSNLGNRAHQLEEAIRQIAEQVGTLEKISGIYESESWGFHSDKRFCNCCISVHTALEPLQVLDAILRIEKGMGRERIIPKREGGGYEDRIIDIDLLFYGKLCYEHTQLVLPHPAMADRRFVLLPLYEIAPGLIHPVLGIPVSQMVEQCQDPGEVWSYGQA